LTKPSPTLRPTIARMMIAFVVSPTKPDTKAVPTSKISSGFLT